MELKSFNPVLSEDYASYEYPIISVIIPVYNVENYLCECVDSVINQSYPFTEIILIDDGSTDSSGKLCDEYKLIDSRIKVVHQENCGQGNARNNGIRIANGKYIIFLDSDDYWRLDALESLCKEAERKNLQVIAFSAQPFSDGAENSQGPSYIHTAQNNLIKNGAESISFAIAHGEYFSQPCLRFYRLDYLRNNGFLFDEGIIHEDESFSFLAYINADRVECLGEQYYYRRYRPGSIMMNLEPSQSAHGCRVAIDTLLNYMENKSLNRLERRLYCDQIKGYISAIFARNRALNEKRKSCQVKIKDEYPNSIKTDTQETIKRVCREVKGIPLPYRIMLYNFGVGYYTWLIYYKIKNAIRCF